MKKQKIALKLSRRQLQCDYIHSMFSDFLKYQEEGVYVKVGTGSNAVTKIAIPFVTMISGDNAQLNKMIGVSYQKKFYPCRLCMSKRLEICNFGNECRKREDRDYEDVIITATEDFMTKITNKTMKPTWSETHCQTFNIDFGENKLFNLFKSSYFTPEEENEPFDEARIAELAEEYEKQEAEK